jgi:hypothetical protein
MPKPCTVCSHDSREDIDRALMSGIAYRTLAAQYHLSPSALCRHTRHLARYLEFKHRHEDQKFHREVLDKLDLLEVRLSRMFHAATDIHAHRVALDCIKEYIRVLALQEKFRARLPD